MIKNLLSVLLMFVSVAGYSQASVTASASVTILKPISITKQADLNFAEVVVHETDGAVVLSPNGSRTVVGGAALPLEGSQAASAASFVVKGEDRGFSISMPPEILLRDGSHSLRVDNFTHNSTGSLGEGGEIVNIGATLHVKGKQEPGTYRNDSDLRVTVQYK